MTIKNILFDLDGTLTDSQEGIIKSLQHTMATLELDVPDYNQLSHYIGPPLHKIFEEISGRSDDAFLNNCVTIFRERYGDVGKFENKLYDGIISLLKRLNGSCSLYIATSKPQVFAKQIAEHFGITLYFNSIYGSNFDNTLSNKTELIGHILRAEKLDPDETIMIGDRSHDIIGAINNFVTPIGVIWGYGDIDELETAGCEKIAQKPSDIIEML